MRTLRKKSACGKAKKFVAASLLAAALSGAGPATSQTVMTVAKINDCSLWPVIEGVIFPHPYTMCPWFGICCKHPPVLPIP